MGVEIDGFDGIGTGEHGDDRVGFRDCFEAVGYNFNRPLAGRLDFTFELFEGLYVDITDQQQLLWA